MNNFIIGAQASFSEQTIRLAIFISLLLFFGLLEHLKPKRQLQISKARRWTNNFSLSFLNTITVSLLLPFAGIGAAILAEEMNWGLFNKLDISFWISIPIYVLVFDLTIYLQHRLFHVVKPLWRLHRVHHTDLDYDVSTGIRFHPLSIVISTLIKLSLVLIMGPPVIAVLISEVLLNATSMFNHSNLRIPRWLEKCLRLFLVTPDMHRIHHSTSNDEHNSNFGFNFPWWDKLFNSYQAQPNKGHETMEIGITGYQEIHSENILPLLIQPFQADRET